MQSKTLQKPKNHKYQDQTSIGKDLDRAHTYKGPLDFKYSTLHAACLSHESTSTLLLLTRQRKRFPPCLITLLSSHAFFAPLTIEM